MAALSGRPTSYSAGPLAGVGRVSAQRSARPATAAIDAVAMLRGSRDHLRPRDTTASAAAARSVVYVGFTSASANAFALSNRSAGIFSRLFATAAATFAGTDRRSFV